MIFRRILAQNFSRVVRLTNMLVFWPVSFCGDPPRGIWNYYSQLNRTPDSRKCSAGHLCVKIDVTHIGIPIMQSFQLCFYTQSTMSCSLARASLGGAVAVRAVDIVYLSNSLKRIEAKLKTLRSSSPHF